MIIPDVSLLVYAHDSESARHSEARLWWEEILTAARPVGSPWVAVLGFLRIMTNPRIMQTAMLPSDAIRRVRAWLARPQVEIVTPGERHAEILFSLPEELGTAGNLTTDAHLAALAIEYRAELASTDTDFARFPRLRWFNPLRKHGRR